MKYVCGTGAVGTRAVLDKPSMGRMKCYKRAAYHVMGKHSRPILRLAHVIFYLFIY